MAEIYLTFMLLLMLLSGCAEINVITGGNSGLSEAKQEDTIPWLEAEDPDGEFVQNELIVGERRLIGLDENPTTGFIWSYEILGDDILEIVSDEYEADDNPKNWPGMGGTRCIWIEAAGPGEAVIEMTCKRGDEVTATVTYKIVVKEA